LSINAKLQERIDYCYNFHIIKKTNIIMKFFNKVKKHIFDKFKEYGLFKDIKVSYEPPIQLYNISDSYFDKEPLKHLASQLLSHENFYSQDKKLILEKIYADCVALNDCLKPLKSIGINYSIDLFGGAIRDYLLDQQNNIKDLDILLRFAPNGAWNSDRYYSEQVQDASFVKDLLKTQFSLAELEAVDFQDNDKLYLKHNKLAQICIGRKTTIEQANFFEYSDRIIGKSLYGENILKHLSGIIRIPKDTFNYELDLLITDRSADHFIRSIDFNICNLRMAVINTSAVGYDIVLPLDYFSKSFHGSFQFFQDVMDKTITFNVPNKTYEQIQHSLGDHKERLIKKYPDYTLKVSGSHHLDKEQSLIEKMMLCHELGESLESSSSEIKIKKTKI